MFNKVNLTPISDREIYLKYKIWSEPYYTLKEFYIVEIHSDGLQQWDTRYAEGYSLKECIENISINCLVTKQEMFSSDIIKEIIKKYDLSDMDKSFLKQLASGGIQC